MVFKSFIGVACIVAFTALEANAAVVYTYSGNNFTRTYAPYTSEMNITLQFETASPLSGTEALINVSAEILSYTMSDGRKTLTQLNFPLDIYLRIDSETGLPTEWAINATNEFGRSIGDTVNRMSTFYGYAGGRDFAEEIECVFISANTGECMGFTGIAGAEVFYSPGSSGTWSVVPVPASVWLLGSGLLGLIGITRIKKS